MLFNSDSLRFYLINLDILGGDVEFRDQNGTGDWSSDSILERYRRYSGQLGVERPLDLSPRRHTEGAVTWISPVMDNVIAGIKIGDPACIVLGIEFIEQDQGFPFGRILKANTARALRQIQLSENQQERIRARVVSMLLAAKIPREFREYSRLLRQVGLGPWRPIIEQRSDNSNPYVDRYYRYLLSQKPPD